MSRPRAARRPLWRRPLLPHGPVPIETGTVELKIDPADPTGVLLLIDGVPSSHIDLAQPQRLEFEYMAWMAAVLDVWHGEDQPVRALHLGGAGCTMARYIDATRPGSHQLAVEIDSELARLVREWFDLPRAPQLRIRVGDARDTLQTSRSAIWDVVIRDAFINTKVPGHLITREAVQLVAQSLAPDGIYLANCADYPPLPLARREVATLFEVFPAVALLADPGQLRGRRFGNVVLVAAHNRDRLNQLAAPMARALRSAAAPARLLVDSQARSFAGTAAPFLDPEP